MKRAAQWLLALLFYWWFARIMIDDDYAEKWFRRLGIMPKDDRGNGRGRRIA